MNKIKINGKLSLDYIDSIVKKYGTDDMIIVMDNTKFQDPKDIRMIATKYKNIRFSVTGGLDPKKEKFDCEYYQRRTYYDGFELSEIIQVFKDIESKIDITWTDTQKAMFIYESLCKKMTYSEIKINNKDYARGLGGLLYNKAVCSGFAIIYKEAMDRIGIECHYQNREGHHSWNIVKLDGEYRGIELTWEVYNKKDNKCGYYYFGRTNNFYDNPKHNIDYEKDETKYPIVAFKDEKLIDNLNAIRKKRIIIMPLKNDGSNIKTSTFKMLDSNIEISYQNESLKVKTDNNKIKYKSYIRDDNSCFVIFDTDTNYKGTNKYFIFELRKDEKILRAARIYSENDLISNDKETEYNVANKLLSQDRLKTKINEFNGYVGYLGKNHQRFYRSNFEEEELHIKI